MGFQALPALNDDTATFWQGGADGVLNIHRCAACSSWFHPPAPVCPECLSLDVAPAPHSGRAVVQGFTINMQPWAPNMEVPYVIAIVSLDDAPGVQMMTRLIDVSPEAVSIGMPVEVSFVAVDDIFLPLFRPVSVVAAQ